MKVIIVYQKKNLPVLKKSFTALLTSKQYSVTFVDCASKSALKNADGNALYYIDITGLEHSVIKKLIKQCNKQALLFGIINNSAAHGDIAWFFHNNACDYLSPVLLKKPIAENRIPLVTGFKSFSCTAKASKHYIICKNSWDDIVPDKEYTFCLLFIEILDIHDLKKHIGAGQLDKNIFSFRHYLENSFHPVNGKLWMWIDSAGIFIFPFNGTSIPAVHTAIRLMLNRASISIEHTLFNQLIRCRIAMHLGNTVYKPRGKTGAIVSDCINSLFHLGQKYTSKEGLYITEDVYSFLNRKIQELFAKAQPFEERQIYSFKNIT